MSHTENNDSAKLLDVKQVAETLNCSTRTVYRLSDGGKMPRPLRIGHLVRWSERTINEWIDTGCKPVKSFTHRRNC